MSQSITSNAVAIATPDLEIIEGQITTTSNQVAEHFGKRHADVIRAIRKLDAPKEFTERNFALSEFTDSTGRVLPAYRLTRDGFTLLAMGFTGKEAMQWKVAYLTAFNKMEAELLARTAHPHNPAIDYDRISPSQAQDLKEIVQAIVDGKIQGFAETWARLHKKFRVNSYLELPSSRFDEARDYLLGKLPEAPTQKLPDADRLKQAYAMATEAGVQMQRAVFNAVVDGTDEQMTYGRVIAALTFDRQGRKIIPHAQYMAGNEMVIAFEDIPRRIDDGSILATDVQFAEVALAIARKQSQRAASRANQQRLG